MLSPPASPTQLESKYAKGSESPRNCHKSLISIYKSVVFGHISISLQVSDKAAASSTSPLEDIARTRVIGKEMGQVFL